MDYNEAALKLHKECKGKIEVVSTVPLENKDDLSTAYTPGVAKPCLEIHDKPETVYDYTRKWNTVAVVSDGTAVLGLGDIGPYAAIPVMEGKSVLFKHFGGVDAFPICINSKDPEEIIKTVKNIEPMFGGINLEDISAPRCFEIERRLIDELNIPVFHDDQHGTAVVVLAALINAMKITGKKIEDIKAVFSGAGAAGLAILKLLMSQGLRDAIIVNSKGAVYEGRGDLNKEVEEMSLVTNREMKKGSLGDIIEGADLFIGVSKGGMLTSDMVKKMAKDPIIFAMANPTPEIMPEEAFAAGARVVGTGRSDFPNQINNVLAFPGIFRGALDARASKITTEMKLAAAHAIADVVEDDKLSENYIIPSPFDERVAPAVAKAVAAAWNCK